MTQETTAVTTSRILILRHGALGDHVLTLPAVAQLRHAYPECELCWIGDATRGQLARPQQLIDVDGPIGVALYADDAPAESLTALLRDAAHVLLYSTRPQQLSARLKPVCDGAFTAWDPRPHRDATCHITTHLCNALGGMVCTAPDSRAGESPGSDGNATRVPHLSLTAREIAAAAVSWQVAGLPPESTVVLHPGSGGRHKCWPAERFASLGQHLQNLGLGVAILDGPAEADRDDGLRDLKAHFPTLAAAAPLHLAAILAPAHAFIGNDSGPGHLAAAVQTPTLSLFGPTEATVWRPLGPASYVVTSPTPRMQDLTVKAVIAALGPLALTS